MSFRRVKAGDPVQLSAPAYNAWCEAAEAFQSGNQGFTASTAGDHLDRTRVRVRNDSGDNRARFDVLGVSGPLFSPTDNLVEFLAAPKLTGTTPTEADHVGRFVILLEPIPTGKIGWALAAGVVPAVVDMLAESDQFADVTDAQAGYLTSGASGAARILWAEAGSGQRRALILLGGAGSADLVLWGKLDGALAYDGTATVSIWSDNLSADTGENIEGVKPPPTMATGEIALGKWVRIRRRADGVWYVDMAPC